MSPSLVRVSGSRFPTLVWGNRGTGMNWFGNQFGTGLIDGIEPGPLRGGLLPGGWRRRGPRCGCGIPFQYEGETVHEVQLRHVPSRAPELDLDPVARRRVGWRDDSRLGFRADQTLGVEPVGDRLHFDPIGAIAPPPLVHRIEPDEGAILRPKCGSVPEGERPLNQSGGEGEGLAAQGRRPRGERRGGHGASRYGTAGGYDWPAVERCPFAVRSALAANEKRTAGEHQHPRKRQHAQRLTPLGEAPGGVSTLGRESAEERPGTEPTAARERLEAELGDQEIAVLVTLARRLLAGQRTCGRLQLEEDRRDWRRERGEELADALVCGAFAEVAATLGRGTP